MVLGCRSCRDGLNASAAGYVKERGIAIRVIEYPYRTGKEIGAREGMGSSGCSCWPSLIHSDGGQATNGEQRRCAREDQARGLGWPVRVQREGSN